jgi:hypothetical protein
VHKLRLLCTCVHDAEGMMCETAYEYLSTSDNLMALESHVTANAEQQAMRLVVMTTAQHPQQPLTVQHELDELRRWRRRWWWPQRRRGRECAGPPVCPLDLHIASAARFCMFFYPVIPRFSHPPHSTEMCHPLTLTAMRIFESVVGF